MDPNYVHMRNVACQRHRGPDGVDFINVVIFLNSNKFRAKWKSHQRLNKMGDLNHVRQVGT